MLNIFLFQSFPNSIWKETMICLIFYINSWRKPYEWSPSCTWITLQLSISTIFCGEQWNKHQKINWPAESCNMHGLVLLTTFSSETVYRAVKIGWTDTIENQFFFVKSFDDLKACVNVCNLADVIISCSYSSELVFM